MPVNESERQSGIVVGAIVAVCVVAAIIILIVDGCGGCERVVT